MELKIKKTFIMLCLLELWFVMLWGNIPTEVKGIFSNYEMNLLQVCKSEQYCVQNEDVKTVFDISRKIYEEDFDGIKNLYKDRDVKAELAAVIGKITNSSYIMEQAMDGREAVNMCTALENLRKQGIEQGVEQGIQLEKI